MSKQPSPFYDLFDGAYEAILTFPVDEGGCGPYFDADGNLDLSKGAELSHEPVQVVDLGGGCYRVGDNSLVMCGLTLFWGDEFIANKNGDDLELVKRLPSKFKHYGSIGKAKSLDVAHRYGGGWAQELMMLRVTIPIEQADAFEREIGLQESATEAPVIDASRHIVLLGDSIFDNASYVPGEMPVIEQLRAELPEWQATLLAVDGDIVKSIEDQLRRLPNNTTHLVISCGGNDALGLIPYLLSSVSSMEAALSRMASIRETFERDYRTMLESVMKVGLPTAVCTIYESIPDLERTLHVALSIFNDVIIREAVRLGLPVIDLRLVCSEAEDYSKVSPIEPSAKGGEKIAKAIASLVESPECFLRNGQTAIILGVGQRPCAGGLRLGGDA
jgi:hypothetical protein